jgi:hypothetical protein
MGIGQSTTARRNASQAMQRDFEAWLALGDGGVSPTWAGFISSINAEKAIVLPDTLSLGPYERPESYATGWAKATPAQRIQSCAPFFTEPLPMRDGPRARAKNYVFPQRERNADDPLEQEIREAYMICFHQLGIDNAATTEWHTSVLDGNGNALFLNPKIPLNPVAGPGRGEICHLHALDMSGHVTLSFADAKEVIEKGWGERHRLCGTDQIHLGYTMIYVPRSVEEVEVFGRILQAGVDFMKSGFAHPIVF